MTIIAGPPESTVKRLLSEAELPTSDITSEKLQPFAEPFFRRLGYERIAREVAPPEIQRTSEFSGICPVSSACMVKQLPRNPSLQRRPHTRGAA